jgi:hypothetical protein
MNADFDGFTQINLKNCVNLPNPRSSRFLLQK